MKPQRLRQKQILLAIGIAVALAVVVAACMDDENKSARSEILTGSAWMITNYERDGEIALSEIDECDLDNALRFDAKGVLHEQVGPVLCDDYDSDTQGTWGFRSKETIINLHPAFEESADWEILELTAETFRISRFVDIMDAEIVVTMSPI